MACLSFLWAWARGTTVTLTGFAFWFAMELVVLLPKGILISDDVYVMLCYIYLLQKEICKFILYFTSVMHMNMHVYL